MRPTSSRLVPRLVLLSFVLLACGPEVAVPNEPSARAKEYARRVCDAGMACDCFTPTETAERCEETLAERFDALLSAPGLVLDEACLDVVLDEQGSCASFLEYPMGAQCTAFKGQTALGHACTPHPAAPVLVNECAGEGASCSYVEGICVDGVSGDAKNEGEPCRADLPTSCNSIRLYCAADGRCHAASTEGEPCDSWLGCGAGVDPQLYCSGWWASGTGICRRKSQLGESCEPREGGSCGSTEAAPQNTWCDPSTSTCVAGHPPAVCGAVWPDMGGT